MRNLKIKNIDCRAALAMMKDSQNARSMIEMHGVLAIIGVLSVGGIAGYSKAMQKYRINKTIEQITLIAGNIRAFFAPQKNYIGVYCYGNDCTEDGCKGNSGVGNTGTPTNDYNGCPIIKKAKIVPDEMLTVSDGKITAITNPFGYSIVISHQSKSIAYDRQSFAIHYFLGNNLEACIELLTHDWTVADVKAINLSNDGSTLKTPISVDTAVAKCSSAISKVGGPQKENGYPYLLFYFDIDENSDLWKDVCL